jgi:hypothetical protein
MFRMHLSHRSLWFGASWAAILLCSTPAKGAPHPPKGESACATAFASAQERERSGHLREARELLLTCAKATCSKVLRQACRTKFTQLDSDDIPTIVPFVADDAGAPRVDVQVRMDGELLTSRLDGQALPVDPGMHEFSFSTDSGVFETQKILIVQGQHNRQISVLLHSPDKGVQKEAVAAPVAQASPVETKAAPDRPASAAPSPHQTEPEVPSPEGRSEGGKSALPYVLGGGGLAGVAAGASVVYLGKTDASSVAADVAIGVSVGVGVAALIVATWVFASPRSSEEKPPNRTAYVLDVQPTPSGAFASVSGAF